MSTRANVILKEGTQKLFFYRHSDGYPEGAMPTLNKLMDWFKEGKLRSNLSQGSGWLIMLGACEYNTIPKFEVKSEEAWKGHMIEYTAIDSIELKVDPVRGYNDWKVGAYEPTTGIHGDIEYLYIIDLEKKTIHCYDSWTPAGIGKNEVDISKYLTKKEKA